MGLGVAHDQDSDGGQGAYARDHEPVTPTEFEDEYSEDGLEHWNDEIAEIEEQLQLNDEIAEELEKRKKDCLRARKRQRRETAEADSEATWKLEQQQQTPEQLQAEEDKLLLKLPQIGLARSKTQAENKADQIYARLKQLQATAACIFSVFAVSTATTQTRDSHPSHPSHSIFSVFAVSTATTHTRDSHPSHASHSHPSHSGSAESTVAQTQCCGWDKSLRPTLDLWSARQSSKEPAVAFARSS